MKDKIYFSSAVIPGKTCDYGRSGGFAFIGK